jgi:hypothetical protein
METNEERIKRISKGIEKVEEANKLLKTAKELRELSNLAQDLAIARKEKEIRELKNAQWKNRDACGRKVKKKLYNQRGEEI